MHVKKLLSAFIWATATFALLPGAVVAAETYATDQGHTEVLFGWSHAGVSMQHAEFTLANGTLNLADNIEKSSVSVVIDANSLHTGFAALDEDLKGKNFLDVATYPEITFKSTAISKTGDSNFDVTGDLTIHGVTKPVTLKTVITLQGNHPMGKFFDYYKGPWIAFRATTEIDHQTFNVGSFSTGPISIEINTELKAQ
jgi:polyisoprenoid-binding protein YceI